MRVVNAKTEGMVVVYEMEPTATDAGPRTLVFESLGGVERLEHYPEHWRLLGDDELLALRYGQS